VNSSRKSSRLFCAVTLGLTLATPTHAENWPSRAMNLIVAFAAGGGVDVSARIQAQGMSERLGQAIVVENVGAAAGMAGSLRVAKAEPDGYMMLIGNSGTHAYNQSLYKTPLYNAVRDFTPVGLATESPRILIARKDLPAANLQEFIAYVRANQSQVQFGSACVLLNMAIGVTVTHVPYRGEGPAQQDLMAGRLDYICATIQTGATLAKNGTVKPIAVMASRRVPVIADVPTIAEQGLPGVEASVWNGFFLPPGAPAAVVRKLNKAMSDTLDDPTVSKRLMELGLEIVPPERRAPDYLAKFVPEEVARWGKVIHAAGISVD
jgi:tripartite-type tricarboxylate transporter receptor subunit TctC